MFHDTAAAVNALVNSLIYMVICVPLLTVLPLLLAMLVEKKHPGHQASSAPSSTSRWSPRPWSSR